jgi:hypothetical protein
MSVVQAGPARICTVCGAQYVPPTARDAKAFAQQHSYCGQPAPVDPRYLGLGDMVARTTQAMGMTSCQSCKERQDALNRLAPRVLPRRR